MVSQRHGFLYPLGQLLGEVQGAVEPDNPWFSQDTFSSDEDFTNPHEPTSLLPFRPNSYDD